jgi:hypothetical protein
MLEVVSTLAATWGKISHAELSGRPVMQHVLKEKLSKIQLR